MKPLHLNIILIVVQLSVTVLVLLNVNEKETPQSQPINIDLYKNKFEEIDKRFEIRDAKDLKQDTIINSIKFQIVTDEKTIRNATNNDVDSIFNAMVTRQRKSSVH